MNRRIFLISSGSAGIGALMPVKAAGQAAEANSANDISWNAGQLRFQFSLSEGRLRQHVLLPADFHVPDELLRRSGVEVGLLCSGDDSTDSGMKLSGGSSARLKFVAKDERRSDRGKTLVLRHADADLHLEVQSYYESFGDLPVVRRQVEIKNSGQGPVGIEYLSSAMLHGLSDPLHYEDEIKIWLAYNSWMAEGQWHCFRAV
jgi:alpha-galactosidase